MAQSNKDFLNRLEKQNTQGFYSDISGVVARFIESDWQLLNQTERTANLEKRAKTNGCAMFILAAICVGVFFFIDILLGLILFVVCLALIALNNVIKGKSTAYIVATPGGGITITSNKRRIKKVYPPGYHGKINT